jgi:hypothetical protein
VLLRLAYLGVTNALALLRLLPMSDQANDAEILSLRHQITVVPLGNAVRLPCMGILVDQAIEDLLAADPCDGQVNDSRRGVGGSGWSLVQTTHRSASAFARGVCGGLRSTSMPSPVNTASKAVVYLVSRSRIKNRNRPTRSPTSNVKLRACRATQSPVGLVAAPRICTRRVAISIRNNT